MLSVIGPSENIVFCEGRPGSLDELLLAHIIPVTQVFVRPVGGKYGMRAFIEGYLGSYGEQRPRYLGFRDRDFDVEPPETPALTLLRGEKPIYLGHRAAIENYLIDADLIWQYWTEREGTPAWKYGPAPSTEEIENHIREAARELAEYQAVRWALAKLKPGDRWPEVRTTWTKNGSGDIPPSLAYDECLSQACELVERFQDQMQGINQEHLRNCAEGYRAKFADERFIETGQYLVWFHGKDHLARLCHYLEPDFPSKHYANWAAENVDVGKHLDLQQLVALAC